MISRKADLSSVEVGRNFESVVKILLISTALLFMFAVTSSSGPSFVEQNVSFEYTSIVTSTQSTEDFFLTVKNPGSDNLNLETYLSGPNSFFPATESSSTGSYTLDSGEEKTWLVRVDPQSSGEKEIEISTENTDLQINQTKTIPIFVRKTNAGAGASEVPGIGLLQIAFLSTASFILYFLQL